MTSQGYPSSKAWYFICSSRRWADLLGARKCPRDHFHVPLEGKDITLSAAYTKPLVRAVTSLALRQEPVPAIPNFHQARSLAAPAMAEPEGTYPTVTPDPHRQLTEVEQRLWDQTEKTEKDRATAVIAKLHESMGHSDMRGLISSMKLRKVMPLVLTAAKLYHCSACEESLRRKLRPVAARAIYEPGECLQVDHFEWKHPQTGMH